MEITCCYRLSFSCIYLAYISIRLQHTRQRTAPRDGAVRCPALRRRSGCERGFGVIEDGAAFGIESHASRLHEMGLDQRALCWLELGRQARLSPAIEAVVSP